MVKNLPSNAGDLRDTGSTPGSWRSPGGGHGNPLQYFCLEDSHGQRSLAGYSSWGHKESNTTEANLAPGEGNGNPLQYSCLENSMDRGAWWAAVHRVAKSPTWLSDFTFTPVLLPGESQGRGAWWAAICGVAQSWTRLNRLSSSSCPNTHTWELRGSRLILQSSKSNTRIVDLVCFMCEFLSEEVDYF